MAFADDLANFLQNQLLAYDPSIDLSANSPAQLKIIAPVVARFGEDPFSTDIATFIQDRLTQEFPNLAADNGGMAEDILSKPLQLLLEPFKREIQLVALGESFSNASIMSDDEADALGANWFEDREEGDYASGPVRIYFSQPTTTRVSTDKAASTSDGRNYFPVQNYFINSSQMAFNRQGNFYFLDVTVRAENPGDTYNVSDVGDINSIDSVPGAVKVSNLTAFVTGASREDNVTFIGRIENSLTERSLVTKRGILARLPNEFGTQINALQIIGAGQEGMDRDILTGTGQGFVHIAGKAAIYGNWLLSSEITYRDDGTDDSITPQPGDVIRFHPGSPAAIATEVITTTVTSILSSTSNQYLLLLADSPYASDIVKTGAFALLKPGTITISGVPGGIAANAEVADNEVHLGGHTDVFVRPSQDAEISTTISNVTDDAPVLAILDLLIPTANQNLATSASSDFLASKVEDGDLLVIDTGAGLAGTYQILEVVDANGLRVSSIFPVSSSSALRARIVRDIQVDLVSPKIPKLPFANSPVSDLQTNVGSTEFRFASLNIQDYGSKIGDTILVVDGPDAGEFTIVNFGTVAGSVIVDRPASATGGNLGYKVYSKQTGIELPLIRIKTIEVLDSTGQTTGITVPYGDSIDIRPNGLFENAGSPKITYDKQLLAFPNLAEWASGGLTSVPVGLGSVTNTTDARYTLGLEPFDGVLRTVSSDASNQIETTEINVPPFIWNGNRDKLIALVARTDTDFPSTIPGIHKTSDIAEAKIGDSITIHDGPNQGNYIILDVRVLELWGKSDTGHRKVAIIQVDPPLKVDPIRTGLDLINSVLGAVLTAESLFGFLNYAADWDNGSGFYNTFLTTLRSALSTIGITNFSSNALLDSFLSPLLRYSYTVGPSAKGIFRNYFLDPVSLEYKFGEDPTTFSLATDGSKTFRIDPSLGPTQILPPSTIPTLPALWNRDLGVRVTPDTYAYNTSGQSFPLQGVQAGDVVEIYPAINDLPARGSMTSSWMCVTQSGSNVIQLILPQSDGTSEAGYGGADNFETIAPGQLLYLDSGPDAGSYVVTNVVSQDWVSNPPVIQVQLDQTLTHTTEAFPVLSTLTVPPSQLDFNSTLPAHLVGTAITFPINIDGKHLKIKVSTDGGATWAAYQHTFTTSDPYTDIAAVIADINADGSFTALAVPSASGNSLVITTVASGPRTRVQIDSTVTATSAHTTLGLTNGLTGAGIIGAGTSPGTNRIYGTGLSQCVVGDWITLYAAKGGTILSDGDDISAIGTFSITAIGSDTSPYWGTCAYIELDRTSSFPTGIPIELRWIRHEAPDTAPTSTSGGGTNITDQFIRFRMYDDASKKLTISDIPWVGASIHPLLPTSTQQIQLESPGIIGASERNYSHKSPYRIIRPNIFRISSSEMADQREGALYYVDVPVVGYGPGPTLNVTVDDGFILTGNYFVEGYTLIVGNENFTYSTEEEIQIVIPNSVLPVGSTSDLTSQFNLSGQNLQITYNNAPLVEDLQTFFDAALDRVTASDVLVRHFLPAYVMLDATYSGGSDEATVAADIITYVNTIDPDNAEIRTDLLQDVIKRRGASTVNLPLTVIAIFHGIDRSIRGMRSTTSIGIGDTPLFKGTFQQAYFISGPNESGISPRPAGEQIFLKRT